MAEKTVPLQDRQRVTKKLKSWLDDVAAYERDFKKWDARVEKIIKRYRDEFRTGQRGYVEAKFNILWANVQTLTASTFARLPKPDVSRRFRDNDPVGRVASMILERGLEYHVEHYPEYRSALKTDVEDRFLGGRGTAWVRYEPHFRKPAQPSGDQITDDVDEPGEELDYECVTVDYVHWKDFGHSVARTWEEVGRVWRKVYMTKEALVERFGEEKAKIIPMDASNKEVSGVAGQNDYKPNDAIDRACIYEGWDKSKKEVVWFSKAMKDFLDTKPDPLQLDQFFPCPKPLYSTLTSETLVPVPDYTLYQDQANELDLLADRIDGLVKALKVMGVYDASIPTLARLFTEGENNALLPVKNWQAFAEKQGLKGAIDIVDLDPIARALKESYMAFEQIKGQVYEITGISDIVRGETQASETATAQRLKGQYASLKLKQYQQEVARFATDVLRIMAQIMCKKFSPQTLTTISAVDQLSPQDQQMVMPAMALLLGPKRLQDPDAEEGPNPLRQFRVDIAADSLIMLDEQEEKEARVEFLGAVGSFLQKTAEVLVQTPPEAKGILVPMLMQMMKFGASGFKVGKSIEGAIDEAADKLAQLASQPPPPQEPLELKIEQMKMRAEQQRAEMQMQLDREKAQADLSLQKEKMIGEQTLERERMQRDYQFEDVKHQREIESREKLASDDTIRKVQDSLSSHETKVKGMVTEASHKQELGAVKAEALSAQQDASKVVMEEMKELGEAIKVLVEQIGKPKRIVRGPDGRASGVETVQ